MPKTNRKTERTERDIYEYELPGDWKVLAGKSDADNDFLNHKGASDFGYCVFGKVVEGMNVVDAIANTKTMSKGGMTDVPRETIKIISVRRKESDSSP